MLLKSNCDHTPKAPKSQLKLHIKEFMARKAQHKVRRRLHGKENAKISRLAGNEPLASLLPVSELKKILWAHLSLYIRIRGKRRTGGWCEKCKTKPIYSANHILSKGDYPGVAFDQDNLFAGCSGCNWDELNHRQSHLEYWRIVLGPDKLAALEERGKSKKWDRSELVDLIQMYKNALEGRE